jgi:carbonic anhydrase/acetyltransferase-like protein (isoleucine patch superfamily)
MGLDESALRFEYAKSTDRCKCHAARQPERRAKSPCRPCASPAGAGAFLTCYGPAVITTLGDRIPVVDPTAWVADSAIVVGDVVLGPESSLWFHAVVRGDVERVRIGARTNVQDNATVHVTRDEWPAIVGAGVTVGHNAVIHGCTIGDHCLIGIGAIVLDGAVLEHECLIGAGAVVTPGMRVPTGSLVLGQPGRVVRPLSADEIAHLHRSAAGYVERLALYRRHGVR